MEESLFTADQWQDCLYKARDHAQVMEYGEAVDLCLNYLHSHLPTWSTKKQCFSSEAPLKIYIACGGEMTRWDNFTGRARQLIDLGEGIPLVQRTINQLSVGFQGSTINIIANRNDTRFSSINGASLIEQVDDIERSVTLEVLEQTKFGEDSETDVLCVHGDVFFSDAAVNIMSQQVQHARSTFCIFGRRHANKYFGNSGGQDFAIYIPNTQKESIMQYYSLLRRLYIGTPLHKYDTWEVISLISRLKSSTTCDIPEASLLNGKASDTYAAIAEMREKKDFHPMHWVDIDDETEDFDFPYEYIERVFRRVVWLGASLTA